MRRSSYDPCIFVLVMYIIFCCSANKQSILLLYSRTLTYQMIATSTKQSKCSFAQPIDLEDKPPGHRAKFARSSTFFLQLSQTKHSTPTRRYLFWNIYFVEQPNCFQLLFFTFHSPSLSYVLIYPSRCQRCEGLTEGELPTLS